MRIRLDPPELEHTQATANLTVEGLALTHFDKSKKTWEINFLRDKNHKFTLKVRGNITKEIVIDAAVKSIEVSTVKGRDPDFDQFPNGYWFSHELFIRPFDQGHDEDFRWVQNLANRAEFLLHARVRRRMEGKLGGTIDSVTELSVPNVIFYTRQKTWYPLTPAIEDIPGIFPIGKTNTMIGADIFCEDKGEVVIAIDGKEWVRLPHVSGSPYQIEFENADTKRFPVPPDELIAKKFIKGDFALYYEFLDVTGAKYDMLCPERVYRSSDCDCNPAFVSTFDS